MTLAVSAGGGAEVKSEKKGAANMANGKKVRIITGKKRVADRVVRGGTGKVAAYVPLTLDVASEKDLTPAAILAGPMKKEIGGRMLSCYVTVDAQDLRFDEGGNLVYHSGRAGAEV